MTDTVQEILWIIDEILDNKELSKRIIKKILDYYGGMQIYLPKKNSAFRDEINQKIYQSFDGQNHKSVIREYNISTQRLYEIIRNGRLINKKSSEVEGL